MRIGSEQQRCRSVARSGRDRWRRAWIIALCCGAPLACPARARAEIAVVLNSGEDTVSLRSAPGREPAR